MGDPISENPGPAKAMALTFHAPIHIVGNLGFTNESGVVWGSGSESDPYVIAGWDIVASAAIGILVQDTSAHFIIEGCSIHDGVAGRNTAIHLDNSSNGMIRYNSCFNNWYGVTLANSSCFNTMTNNNCSDNRFDGIELYPLCNGNVISGNTFAGNLDGIHLESSRYNLVTNNVMINNGVTVLGYDVLDCTTNDIDSTNSVNGRPVYFFRNQSGTVVPAGAGEVIVANCTDFVIENQILDYACVGIELLFSSGVRISNNTCSNNSYGVLLWFSDSNTLDNNTVFNNEISPDNWWYGVGLLSSNYNTISGNRLSDSLCGLGLQLSSHNTIVGNRCTNNSNGVNLLESELNRLYQNEMIDNANLGVFTLGSIDNVIWNNTFIGNNGATSVYDASHIQADEVGSGNWWNSSDGYGNYWSDWSWPDSDMDGIVDLPYNISGSVNSKDFYPLATPPEPIPEIGAIPLLATALLAILLLIVELRRRVK